ncbi:MAG TPA: hypothetical protein VMS35_04230 [Nitrososphaeraceae archaeon]|nr:hypothetical protein [Nitrososphaeraceae archaeon]
MKSARITKQLEPLEAQQIDLPKPMGPQVFVKVILQEYVIVIFSCGMEDRPFDYV